MTRAVPLPCPVCEMARLKAKDYYERNKTRIREKNRLNHIERKIKELKQP